VFEPVELREPPSSVRVVDEFEIQTKPGSAPGRS
jgi:hypothetical protein